MSAPQIVSIEIGDVDAMTLVVTFDQDIVAAEPPADLSITVNPDNIDYRSKGVRIYP